MFNPLINVYFWLILGLIALAVVLVGLSITIRVFKGRARRKASREGSDFRRCLKCGYVVDMLEVPRCPECGAAIGFTKSFKELGVSDEELRQAHKTKLDEAAD